MRVNEDKKFEAEIHLPCQAATLLNKEKNEENGWEICPPWHEESEESSFID